MTIDAAYALYKQAKENLARIETLETIPAEDLRTTVAFTYGGTGNKRKTVTMDVLDASVLASAKAYWERAFNEAKEAMREVK